MKNYRSIILLPIFSKIYEKLVFNSIFNCLMKLICLLKLNLFLSDDSCVSQLRSVTHEIYKSFDFKTLLVD